MKQNFLTALKGYPFFAWLLPVFFVLHGYYEFHPLLPIRETLMLGFIYLCSAFILFLLAWLFFRSRIKSALLVFLLLSINFFFGPMQDWLKSQFPGSLPGRYIFLLPVIFILMVLAIIFLKKTRIPFIKLNRYLNLLLLFLIVYDLFSLVIKDSFRKPVITFSAGEFTDCNDCNKPDVYLILADEYGGNKQLKNVFNFDNSAFENELKKRGFHILEDSRSNYNYTMFSVPSIMNMDYIEGIEGRNKSMNDRRTTTEIMKNNRVTRFFQQSGYEIHNYSIFDLPGQPTRAQSSFLPAQIRPLVSQTFLYRVQKDLWYHLVTDLKLTSSEKSLLYRDKKNNLKFIELTKNVAQDRNGKAKFVYTHLMMPHYPYYFDKDGNETAYQYLSEEYGTDDTRYISYLQYCNKVFLELIDKIQSSYTQPPIIIFMSDHGFKSFKNNAIDKSSFSNINAISLPDSAYSGFYKGMSNVNQFRVLLNTQFRQNFPLLKDSVSFITE